MIARYTRPAMGRIWDDENKFGVWLEIEVLACEAQAQLGVIPKEAAANIRRSAKFNVPRILEIEEEVADEAKLEYSETTGALFADVVAADLDRLSLWEFWIGNTDWSVAASWISASAA